VVALAVVFAVTNLVTPAVALAVASPVRPL